ncbi:MAG: S8 family serine peptidase, partial [Marinoscillum sp.]
MKRFIFITIISAMVQSAFGQQSKMLKANDFNDQSISKQWVYVKYKHGELPPPASKALANKLNKTEKTTISNLVKLQVPEGVDPIDYCNQLRKSNNLIYADPIVEYYPLATTNDPLSNNQYYLDKIRAYDAWSITTGDDDITIGIIDSGIDTDHEDIVNNLWLNTADPIDDVDNDGNGYVDDYYGYDFADEDNDPNVQNGNHGMIVGGIAGASTNNGIGIAGVGYNTKVVALKG